MDAGSETGAGISRMENWIAASAFDEIAQAFAAIAVEAGAIVMDIFAASCIETRFKNDKSPVCEADERAEALVLERLGQIAPHLPVIAEESAARGVLPPHRGAFLLVDPLDGTREFVAHGREFTINIALIVDGAPQAGAIYAPALGRLWFGGRRAFAAQVDPGAPLSPREQWRELYSRKPAPAGLIALVSRSHLDDETRAFLARGDIAESREEASSLKFCQLAEGSADVYPRLAPTMEWDVAAGDAILRAAGGTVLNPKIGDALAYGKAADGYRNGPFIAWGDPKRATVS
jgi:3'(2'), 5'-bisphosphate nucleotidase